MAIRETFLISDIDNGDKIVLKRLSSQLNILENEKDESEDIDEKRVSVSFHELVHKGSRIEGILKDLLDLPIKNIANILHHPVMMLYIERRWLKTKWMFMVSFILYLTFLLMFSGFLGLMYFRQVCRKFYIYSLYLSLLALQS